MKLIMSFKPFEKSYSLQKNKMEKGYTLNKGEKDKDHKLASMQKYVDEKPEMDKVLERLISPYLRNKQLKILDACCGNGHLSAYLNQISPNSTYLGVDVEPYLIERARELNQGANNLSFEVGGYL